MSSLSVQWLQSHFCGISDEPCANPDVTAIEASTHKGLDLGLALNKGTVELNPLAPDPVCKRCMAAPGLLVFIRLHA